MKKTALSILVLCASLYLSGCIITTEEDATLFIYNDSSYIIDEVYLTEVGSGSWGPNLIAGNFLDTGDSVEIYDIECDYYDVRIVDEFGDACEIFDFDLCLNDTDFHITNSLVDNCFAL